MSCRFEVLLPPGWFLSIELRKAITPNWYFIMGITCIRLGSGITCIRLGSGNALSSIYW